MNKTVKVAILGLFSVASLGAMEKGTIKRVELPKSVKLDKNGHFSDGAGAMELFRRAAHGNQALGKPKSAKKMTKEAHAARFATAQLFKVKCEDGKSYILKEIKGSKEAKEEIKRLERVRTSKRLAPYIGQKVKDNLQINVPLAYVSYNHKGKDHILVIMRKAKGISLQGLMEQFQKNPHDTTVQKIHAKAYYDLGAALAVFYSTFTHPENHCSFFTTLVHGDMHNGNIFYHEDDTGHVVTLIDNERMAKSLDKDGSISVDLGFLFVTSPFVMEWSHSGFLKDFDAKRWYSIVIPSFFLGFIRKFPKDERAGWFQHFKGFLLEWDSKVNEDDSRHLRGLIKEQLLLLEQQLVAEGKTALHVAARYSALSPVLERMLFVEKTKAVRDKDKNGNRALHEAAYFGNLTNVVLLLKADSSVVGAKNDKGETPIFKARYKRDSDTSRYNCVIEEFKKHGAY